ncbi:DDE-type integrase/transposase/recombinase [Pseudomonas sp. PDM18]|uniref:DDE-type integrase/transposase/recombinase n=1 Tax=Pseudomonas nitroreducens TaxID=46680 RepID=A0A5R9AIH3_PSENT|nr:MULTISPECIES: DDE-type integrase/transposase/recombinase [Pseudomonas]MBD9679439.1 DDE-type integrase/transposase/recombinase [Pseudomonas sp. PDM18]TLP77656.1 DDE-type integrase/transposase/recombinase [Pseudomonas nitroreducens]
MLIKINEILTPIEAECEIACACRVIWINAKSDAICLFKLSHPDRMPEIYSLALIKELLASHKISRTTESVSPFILRHEDDIPRKELEKRDDRWKYIEKLVNSTAIDEAFLTGSLGSKISEQAKTLAVDSKKIYRLIYRYWRFGQTKNSLLDNREKSGGKGKQRIAKTGTFLGRPPKKESAFGLKAQYALTESDIHKIRCAYTLYMRKKSHSHTTAYQDMIEKYYYQIDPTDISRRIRPELGTYPSINQFIYQAKKVFDPVMTLRSRIGDTKYEKDHKVVTGTVQDNLWGPGHRYEIDATIADIYLVSSIDRNRVIGRPVVYSVIDSFSGMFAGIHVGLEGPSWYEARQALFNSFTDKVEFCKEIGIDITPDEWPSHHLPREITADRGEILSLPAEGMIDGLDVNLTYCPPRRPDLKPMVESHFRTLKRGSRTEFMPGAVVKVETQRGERDPRLDATLNIKEFTKIIVECVLNHIKTTRRPEYLSLDMITDGIRPTPLSIWNWAIENDLHESHQRAADIIYLNLLPRKRAMITRSGIRFNGLRYFIDNDPSNAWIESMTLRASVRTDIYHDCITSNHIWIQIKGKGLQRCSLRASDLHFSEFRAEEVEDIKTYYKTSTPEESHDALMCTIEKNMRINEVLKKATAEKAQHPKLKTKKAKTENIKINRNIEKAISRQQNLESNDLYENVIQLEKYKSPHKSKLPPQASPLEISEVQDFLRILAEVEGTPNE